MTQTCEMSNAVEVFAKIKTSFDWRLNTMGLNILCWKHSVLFKKRVYAVESCTLLLSEVLLWRHESLFVALRTPQHVLHKARCWIFFNLFAKRRCQKIKNKKIHQSGEQLPVTFASSSIRCCLRKVVFFTCVCKDKRGQFQSFLKSLVQLYLSPGVPGIRRDENTNISICQLGSDHTWIQNTEK